MKKTYMTPAIEAIKVKATEILAGSPSEGANQIVDGVISGSGSIAAKSGNGDFDFSFDFGEDK